MNECVTAIWISMIYGDQFYGCMAQDDGRWKFMYRGITAITDIHAMVGITISTKSFIQIAFNTRQNSVNMQSKHNISLDRWKHHNSKIR